jgi:hypothetical protein
VEHVVDRPLAAHLVSGVVPMVPVVLGVRVVLVMQAKRMTGGRFDG